MNEPRIVIVGGGFAGLYAARELRHARARITLVDRHNYHLFQPLLYQVATAALNPSDIAAPIRSVLARQANIAVIMGEVSSIQLQTKSLALSDGTSIEWDYLLLGAGATHSYFGHPEWAPDAPGLKTIDDATEIRRRVLTAFEAAERESDPVAQSEWLTFVIVGGGPTGVELAGALSEIARHTMIRDFRHIDPSRTRVILIEGHPAILPSYPADLSDRARKQLERLGATVRTSAIVTAVTEREVKIGEERIGTRTVLWAAGVQAAPVARTLGVPVDKAGRVLVDANLSIPGHPTAFVAGDLAAVLQADGSPVPGVAPAAIQEGTHAARNIIRLMKGEPALPFRYWDKGSLATIGRAAAVAEFGKLHVSGFIAWFAWLAIHIFFLIGFRNRFLVITQWAWAYLTYQRGARLITDAKSPTR